MNKPATPPVIVPPQLSARTTVTVLLEGGTKASFTVDSQHAIIGMLLAVLNDFEGRRKRQLFQIPMPGGGEGATLTFPCHRLVAVELQPVVADIPQHPLLSLPARNLPEGVEASRLLVIDNFLPESVVATLKAYVAENAGRFVPTTTATNQENYRESIVLHEFGDYAELMRQSVRRLKPRLQNEMACAELGDNIEAQLTGHNDGNYYKLHNDNGSRDTATRELTYVYYFHNQPKAFSGGELKLYDSQVRNGRFYAAETFQLVEPKDNRIVFFMSRYLHEVLPIQCPSRAFQDSRFTINGWIRRPDYN